MSRNQTDFVDDDHMPPHGAAPAPASDSGPGPLPCTRCGTLTQRATLNAYGARCFHCYAAFCREPQPAPRFMADKRTGGNKAWAHALKAREEAGETLSQTQRDMYRAGLRAPLIRADDAENGDRP